MINAKEAKEISDKNVSDELKHLMTDIEISRFVEEIEQEIKNASSVGKDHVFIDLSGSKRWRRINLDKIISVLKDNGFTVKTSTVLGLVDSGPKLEVYW